MESSNKKLKLENKNYHRDKNKNTNTNEKKDEKDIMDYFIIGEDEDNNSIDSEFNKAEKSEEKNSEENNENGLGLKYKVSSFISSNYRPDLYSPLGIIGGNKYNLRKNSIKGKEKGDNEEIEGVEEKEEEKEGEEKEEEEEEEKESKIMEEKLDNVKKELDKYKVLKLGRYYVLDDDITVKCHNCGEIGHIKDYCPYTNLKFCHRCLSHEHNDKDCKNKKCFRCNKSGHNKNECNLKDSEILICFNCEFSGHRKNECLIKPSRIDSRFIKNNGLSCFHCGSSNHLICPLSERENIELKKENIDFDEIEEDMISSKSQEMSSDTPVEEEKEIQEKKNSKTKKNRKKQIIENIKNDEIKFTIFCTFCGETHRNEECPLKDDPKFSNEFDTFRKNICNKILERRKKDNEEDQRFNNMLKKRKRDNDDMNDKQTKNNNKRNNNSNKNDIYDFMPFLDSDLDLNKSKKGKKKKK